MFTMKLIFEIDVRGASPGAEEKIKEEVKDWIRSNTRHIDRYNFGNENYLAEDEEEISAEIDSISIEE